MWYAVHWLRWRAVSNWWVTFPDPVNASFSLPLLKLNRVNYVIGHMGGKPYHSHCENISCCPGGVASYWQYGIYIPASLVCWEGFLGYRCTLNSVHTGRMSGNICRFKEKKHPTFCPCVCLPSVGRACWKTSSWLECSGRWGVSPCRNTTAQQGRSLD